MKIYSMLPGVCLTLSLSVASSVAIADHAGVLGGDDALVTMAEEAAADINKMNSTIAAAKSAIKGAREVGFEWRDLGKILRKAEKAALHGDVEKALLMARVAQSQGESAQIQANSQANAGPRFDSIIANIRTYEEIIASADSERKAAAKLGFEWRDTGKMIKKAKQAAASFRYGKAVKLAKLAKFQGEAGQAQAATQANAGPRF